mgnify:CR=1 FL=1
MTNLKTTFLSFELNEKSPVYGGKDDKLKIKKTSQIKEGKTSNNLHLSFPNHLGTHIDFPRHFSDKGKTLSNYPASFWIFNKVGFLKCSIHKVPEMVDNLDRSIEILILKTGFGKNRGKDVYWKNQPVIPASYASLLKNKFPNIRVFGFDMISLTSLNDKEEGKRAHINFLINHDILILEDMNLDPINTIPDTIILSPLQIQNADGVPCTVIANFD